MLCLITIRNHKLFAYLEDEEDGALESVGSILCNTISDERLTLTAGHIVNSVTSRTSKDSRVRVLIEAYFHIRNLNTGKSMGSLPLISDLDQTKSNKTELNYYGAHTIQLIDTSHLDDSISKLIIHSQCVQLQLLLNSDIDDNLIVPQIGAHINFLTYESDWLRSSDFSQQQQLNFSNTYDLHQVLCARSMWLLDGFTRPQNEYRIDLEVRQLQLELQQNEDATGISSQPIGFECRA